MTQDRISDPAPSPGRRLTSTDELCAALGIDFSDEQLTAITAPLEPAVVVAGAGSGKTTVMAARVVWLVGTGQVTPEQVLGLTFTRKAAAELASRITSSLAWAGVIDDSQEAQAGEPVISTYDSFAARLVNEHGLRIGVESDPRMLTGASRYRLAARVVAAAPGPLSHLSRLRPGTVTDRLLQLDAEMSSHLVTREQVAEHARETLLGLAQAPTNNRGRPYVSVVKAEGTVHERVELLDLVDSYRALKAELGLVEFGDQMSMAARLVEAVPAVGATLRSQFAVVLLDEYQDTSSAQAKLLKGLFSGPDPQRGRGHAVTAVGDPFQAIYGWRGAAASNILQFAHDFPLADGGPAAHHSLVVNRRSGQKILDVANVLARPLRQDPLLDAVEQTPVELEAPDDRQGAGEVWAAEFETWPEEVQWVADRVVSEGLSTRTETGDPDWSRIAVLVRRNADIGPLFAALDQRDVPTEIVGLGGLLRLPEVADVVSTLRLVDDVTANPDVVRLLSGPRWRIGPRDFALLGRRAVQIAREGRAEVPDDETLAAALQRALTGQDPSEVVSLLDAVADPGTLDFSPEARERLARFGAELGELRSHLGESLSELVSRVVSTLGLDVELAASAEAVASQRSAQLAAFLDQIGGYTDLDQDASLSGLLAWLDAELAHGTGLDQATASEQNSVKLLTVHRSKGLEWEVVFLPGLVKGVFPSDQPGDNWVRSAGVLPADLRGDADGVPQLADLTDACFKDYGQALTKAQQLSEDRLAYVAVTRAREKLIGSGHQWTPGNSRPRTPSPYLRAIQAEAEEQGRVLATVGEPAETNPLQAEALSQSWPVAVDVEQQRRRLTAAEMVERARDVHATTGVLPETPNLSLDHAAMVERWDAEIDHLVAEAREASNPVVEVPMPANLSASALMAARRDPQEFAKRLLRPTPREVSPSALVGTRFHEWVERRFQASTLVDPDDWPDSEATTSDVRLGHLTEAFESGPWADRQPVAVEVPFVLVLGGSQVRGRIDAVYAGDREGIDYQVIDWKTSNATADPIQLSVYRLAWAEAMGVPVDRVEAAFVHVQSGRLVRPDDFMTREQLVSLARGTGLGVEQALRS